MRSKYFCHMESEGFARTIESPFRMSADGAAKIYAERICAEHPEWYDDFTHGVQVRVRCEFTGETSTWEVRVEARPFFTVNSVANEPVSESDKAEDGQ